MFAGNLRALCGEIRSVSSDSRRCRPFGPRDIMSRPPRDLTVAAISCRRYRGSLSGDRKLISEIARTNSRLNACPAWPTTLILGHSAYTLVWHWDFDISHAPPAFGFRLSAFEPQQACSSRSSDPSTSPSVHSRDAICRGRLVSSQDWTFSSADFTVL